LTWKCTNCGRTFELTARISIERTPQFDMYTKRIIVDKPCCPFCESIEFEEVKHEEKPK